MRYVPTLSEIEDLLGNSVGAGLTFADELNLVRARLIPGGNWKGSKELIPLTVHTDANGSSIVTLPREFDTILAGAIRSANALCTGQPLGVKNEFSEFSKNGLGYGGLTDDFQEVTGRFSVFQEWDTAMRIRLKFERSETAGTVYLSGTLDGEDVWALNTSTWEKREAIAISGTTTVTSTKYYDAAGFKAQKPVTNGRISLYTVDDSGTETLCGLYEPSDKFPCWKRYKVPTCSTDDMFVFLALCKRSYVPVSADDDEVFPGNLAALEKGLEARKAERSQDLVRAGELWAEAKALLVEESENETGAGAEGVVNVADDFQMSGMSCGWGGGGYWPWPGSGYGG